MTTLVLVLSHIISRSIPWHAPITLFKTRNNYKLHHSNWQYTVSSFTTISLHCIINCIVIGGWIDPVKIIAISVDAEKRFLRSYLP